MDFELNCKHRCWLRTDICGRIPCCMLFSGCHLVTNTFLSVKFRDICSFISSDDISWSSHFVLNYAHVSLNMAPHFSHALMQSLDIIYYLLLGYKASHMCFGETWLALQMYDQATYLYLTRYNVPITVLWMLKEFEFLFEYRLCSLTASVVFTCPVYMSCKDVHQARFRYDRYEVYETWRSLMFYHSKRLWSMIWFPCKDYLKN